MGTCTRTNTAGQYTLTGLATGQYKVEFRSVGGANYLTQFYDNKRSLSEADAITVNADATTANISAAMAVAGRIAGTTTFKGQGVSGISVCASTLGQGAFTQCTTSNGNGEYILGDLTPGQYEVYFSAFHNGFSPQYYDKEDAQSLANAVTVADGATTPGIDAELSKVPLQAVAGESLETKVGSAIAFDGSGSTPASQITAYRWEFGDGTSASEQIAHHAYKMAGTYTATLTVQRGAESSKQSTTVTVTAPPEHQVTITVENENKQPIPEATVLYESSKGVRTDGTTNSEGEVSLAGLPDGTDAVYAQAKGYKPSVGEVAVSGGGGEATIVLTSGAVGATTLNAHEMTLAEIKAAGINPSDPANQNVYGFEVHLSFPGEEPYTFSCHLNENREFVGDCGGGRGGGGVSCSTDACYGEGYVVYPGYHEGHPYIQWLVMHGKAAVLKQFFAVSMVVQNLSPEPFKFTHGQATLTIPEGMSLAPTAQPQSLTQNMPDIPGEGAAEANWFVRGDKPGEYFLDASYHAQQEPVENPVELEARLAKPLKVWGAEALGFRVQGDSGHLKEGVPYHVRIGLYDKANIPLYNVAISVDGAQHERFVYQPDQQFESTVSELTAGATIYAPQDILVPDANGGAFDPSTSSASFVGEAIHPGQGIEEVTPPPLYTMSSTLATATMIHLHWQPSPGAEGYEVFSTPSLDTPFAAGPDAVRATRTSTTTVTRLPATATDAYIARGTADPPRFYAVTTLIDGQSRLEHPVREPSIQGPVGGPLTLSELLAGGENESEFCLQCAMNRITHADPVDAPTGNFWHGFTDLSVPGRGIPLDLTRTYNSGAANIDGSFGYGWSFPYAMSLTFPDTEHVTVNQENGSQVTFTKEPEGAYAAPPRVTATLVHNSDGTWTFVRRHRDSFTFDSTGRLTKEADLNGNTTSLAYNGGGELETVTDPAGRKLKFAYTGTHITSVADPLGRTVRYSYDAAGDLTDVTDVAGGDTHFTYDAEHRMLTMRTPDQAPGVTGSTGATVANVYDSEGRVIEQTDQLGRTTKFSYSGEPLGEKGGTTTITDPKGNVTVQTYRFGELTSETKGYGTLQAATWKFEYDQSTLGLASVTDPDGHTIKSTYDAEGNTLSTEDALGRKTVNTYDSLNDLLTSTDPMGVTTTNAYDSHGNLLSTSRPLAGTSEVQTTTYTYGDPSHPGDVTAMTDPDGKRWEYTYDADGDRTSSTDPLGDKTTSAYNAIDWLMSTTSPRGNVGGANSAGFTTTYAHNAFGQVTETVDPLGHKTTNEYDPDQNLIASTDADGNVTRNSYDAADEQIAVHRADGTTTQTTYWPDGEVKEQIDGAGHVTRYEYDPLGRIVAVTDPLGRITRHGYDPAGNETSMTDPEGQVTTKTYDAGNELTSISYSDGKTPDVTGIAYNADGERTSMTDGTGTSTFAYDSLNRMTSSTGGSGATVKYAYDLDGHLTTLTYPNGKSVSRSYDAAGDLTGVTDWLGHTTHFSYDTDSNPTSYQYPNGVDTSFTYDDADRVASIADTSGASTLAGFKYTRDANGDVTSETSDNGDENAENFAYDPLNQLTAENKTPYGYDAADNPTTFGAGTTQSFDAANELTSRTEPGEASEHPGEGAPKEKEGPSAPGGPPASENPSTLGAGSGSTSTTTTTTTENPGGGVSGYHASYTPPTKTAAVTATSESGGKLISPKLHALGSHDLLVAFISASGPASGAQHVVRLSGDGLHWSLVVRNAQAGGDTEIWQAHAGHAVSGPVTVRLHASGYPATLTVIAFSSSSYIEAHTTSHGHASTPAVTFPDASGTLIVAAGSSSGQKAAIAPLSGQQLLAKYFDSSSHSAGWIQQTQASSTSARIADANPVAQWGMAAVAIASHSAQAARVVGSAVTPASSADSAGLADPAGGASPAVQSAPSAIINTASGANSARSATTDSRARASSDSASSSSVTRGYTYNDRGDRTGESSGATALTLSYDQANRLIGVGSNISYAYNGDGLRVSKTVSGVTTQFVWSEAEELPALLQDGSTYYIYGPEGAPIEQISGSTPIYLHQDQQGSTRLLTDAEGTVVGRYDYDAWGKVISHTGSDTTDIQYNGQYTDPETDFQYLRARYYDPSTGQFLTSDPLVGLTRTPFDYASNDPLDRSDPSGLISGWTVLKVVGAGLGIAAAVVCDASPAAPACIALEVGAAGAGGVSTGYQCATGSHGSCVTSIVCNGSDVFVPGTGAICSIGEGASGDGTGGNGRTVGGRNSSLSPSSQGAGASPPFADDDYSKPLSNLDCKDPGEP